MIEFDFYEKKIKLIPLKDFKKKVSKKEFHAQISYDGGQKWYLVYKFGQVYNKNLMMVKDLKELKRMCKRALKLTSFE
jgi:hypothetical protein